MFSAASVCLFVCVFVNTITSERVNIGWWNLVGRCIVRKSRPSSNLGLIAPPPGCALSKCGVELYDVGKISAGCLVGICFIIILLKVDPCHVTITTFKHHLKLLTTVVLRKRQIHLAVAWFTTYLRTKSYSDEKNGLSTGTWPISWDVTVEVIWLSAATVQCAY